MNEDKKSQIFWVSIAVIITLGLIISTFIAARAFSNARPSYGVITVTGSAKKQIKSDFAVWTGTFSVKANTLSDAYKAIKVSQSTVNAYLLQKNIPANQISFSSISTITNYAKNYNGMDTNQIEGYTLIQNVEINSNDVDTISNLARESTELIDKGVEFQSQPPQYFYTKIADLKIDMLASATKDAKTRAEKVAENAGTKIIGVKTSRMGVFQITPLYSNEISDYGINDTTSIDKEIMAVMNCEFKAQ